MSESTSKSNIFIVTHVRLIIEVGLKANSGFSDYSACKVQSTALVSQGFLMVFELITILHLYYQPMSEQL